MDGKPCKRGHPAKHRFKRNDGVRITSICRLCLNDRNSRYGSTEKGKKAALEKNRRYAATEKGKKVARECQRRYRISNKGRRYHLLYKMSEEGKKRTLERNRRYMATEKGKKKARECQLRYRATDKGACARYKLPPQTPPGVVELFRLNHALKKEIQKCKKR